MIFEVGFTLQARIVNRGQEIVCIETEAGTTLLAKAKRLSGNIVVSSDTTTLVSTP